MSDQDQSICGTTLRSEWVQQYGHDQIRAARSGASSMRDALCRYIKQGLGAGFSTGELVDWLGVSSPSILDEVGLSESEAAEVMEVLGLLTDDEIESIRIGPEPNLP